MTDILYALYDLARSQHPYEPVTDFERETARRLEQALSFKFPMEYKHVVFELKDSLQILGYTEAQHAFSLGLNMGLMIAEELWPLRTEL